MSPEVTSPETTASLAFERPALVMPPEMLSEDLFISKSIPIFMTLLPHKICFRKTSLG